LKAKIVKPAEALQTCPLPGNGHNSSVESGVLCVVCAKAIYNEDQLPLLKKGPEMAVRRVGGGW
jgi:hypothetical protein